MSSISPAWDVATERWYAVDQAIRDKAAPRYREGIRGHGGDMEYCAGVLQEAIDWALSGGNISSALSAKADEYEEIMRAEEIMEGLNAKDI